MRRINYKTVNAGIVLALGLLGLSGGVQADPPVQACQQVKLGAASKRAQCLAQVEKDILQGGLSNTRRDCETQFDQAIASAGTACRYIDNGNGTVSDLNTLLMWEKKVTGSSTSFDSRGVGDCRHCVDDRYAWLTTVSDWLSALNGRTGSTNAQSGFAGFEDWRVPTHIELQTILLQPFPCGTTPCIDPIFGPTAASSYWSFATLAFNPDFAWVVAFDGGFVGNINKDNDLPVRGVRSGR
jgi:Protein of unknown function (DUF1566)